MDLYLIIVIIMLALAVLSLIVGVANDAVNFLNSALGSKVAPPLCYHDGGVRRNYYRSTDLQRNDGGRT